MTARSRSLKRMVRRYVLHCDFRKLEAKTVTRGGPVEPTGNRKGPALPGWSGWRLGKELRRMEMARHARLRWESDMKRNRGVTPNDPKLSDRRARRDGCVAGGKAEAGSSRRDAPAGSLQRMVRRWCHW